MLRRNGLHYKAQTQYKTHWTKHHYFWLARTIDGLSGSLKVNLELLLRQLKALNEVLSATLGRMSPVLLPGVYPSNAKWQRWSL